MEKHPRPVGGKTRMELEKQAILAVSPLEFILHGGYAGLPGREIPPESLLREIHDELWPTPDATIYTLAGSALWLEFTYLSDGSYSHDSLWPSVRNLEEAATVPFALLSDAVFRLRGEYPGMAWEPFHTGEEAVLFFPASGCQAHYHNLRFGTFVLSTVYSASAYSPGNRRLLEDALDKGLPEQGAG